ncbi:MAG TPA: hypothetical protein VEZ72_14265, partial [Paenibacillus sp.]|nr:hypothetical protein [Paenibacillus sp.]
PGIAPESFATEAYATKREESTQAAVAAADAVDAPAVEALAAEQPEPSAPPSQEQPAAQTLSATPPQPPQPPQLSTLPTVPSAPQGLETEPLPSYYKTEPAMGDLSPLHVPWSGMNDGPAVHPFAPLPTPVVPAGAPTYFPGPVGFGAMPSASFGAFGGVDASAYATYGAAPEPFAMPSFPQPFPQPSYPPYAAPAAHDCGCGGQPAPRLPYALPLRESALRTEARAFSSAAAAQPQTEPQAAPPVEAAQPSAKAEPKRKARSRGKSARVSGTDRLRSFLKRATGAGRPKRGKSKPWVNG